MKQAFTDKDSTEVWMTRTLVIAIAILCGVGSAQVALFTGSDTGSASGNPIAASADFTLSGTTLTILLKNTSTFDYSASPNSYRAVPTDVLTGLFWDLTVGTSLTETGATAPAITVAPLPANLLLASTPGGWDFAQSLVAAPLSGVTQHYGLGTAGFGIFDGGTSSGGPGSPTNYGIMNSLYVDGEGNPSVNGTPYAKDSITFTLTVPSGFDIQSITNVRFQYGTALDEGDFPGGPGPGVLPVPEPATLSMFGIAALGFGAALRRRRPRTSRQNLG
jgi:hypothetical protein